MTSHAAVASVKKNYFYNTVLNVSNIAFPLVTFTYVSRVLGPATFGKVAFASSFVGYFLLLACLGIPIYGSREIARVRSGTREELSRLFSELFFLNLCSTVASLLLFLIPLLLVDKLRQETVLFLVTGSIILTNFFSVDWLFQGLENYRNVTLRSLSFKIIGLAVLFLLVRSESDYLWYAAVSVIVTGGSNLAGFIMRKDLVGLRTTGLSLRSHVRPILVLFGTALTTYIYTYLDSVMLGFLADDKAVGLYSAASKITRSVIVVITSLSLVLVPRISFYVRNNLIDEYRKITQKSAHVILFLALPLSVGLYFLAPGIVLIFAGRQFLDAAAAIHIMAPLLVVVGISNFYSLQILYPNGQENKMLIAALCAAAIDVGLNFALIRPFGFRGTALASLGTEITTLVLFVLFTKKQYRTFRLVNRQTLTYLFASAAMGALLYSIMKFLPDPLLSIIVSSVCGVLLYAGILSCAKDPLLREILHLVKDRGISGIRSLLG
jgi:O-antigen/teichoic acid export membrane protein